MTVRWWEAPTMGDKWAALHRRALLLWIDDDRRRLLGAVEREAARPVSGADPYAIARRYALTERRAAA
jgi:hypothetical protein